MGENPSHWQSISASKSELKSTFYVLLQGRRGLLFGNGTLHGTVRCFLVQDTLINLDSDFDLSRKLDALKRHVREHLPMMRLLRKAIPVTFRKQATLPTREKQSWRIERMSWIYWYDPKDLIRVILSATKLTDHMHFGVAHR